MIIWIFWGFHQELLFFNGIIAGFDRIYMGDSWMSMEHQKEHYVDEYAFCVSCVIDIYIYIHNIYMGLMDDSKVSEADSLQRQEQKRLAMWSTLNKIPDYSWMPPSS